MTKVEHFAILICTFDLTWALFDGGDLGIRKHRWSRKMHCSHVGQPFTPSTEALLTEETKEAIRHTAMTTNRSVNAGHIH